MIKSRKKILIDSIENEIVKDFPDIKVILNIIENYEKNNLKTIDKLRKKRLIEINRIKGALKQTIHAHGPITPNFINSATKRIHGALLDGKDDNYKISMRTLIVGILIGIGLTIISLKIF